MILSETEVQLGTDSAGIMVLPDSYEAGEEAQRYLPLGRRRARARDHAEPARLPGGVRRRARGARGHRRAARARSRRTRTSSPSRGRRRRRRDLISVTVEDFELCPRFSVRVFEDVQVGPSPLWLKARLMAAGQRPISNVVDITNYVMLLLGQPMHAYDLDRVAGPGAARARCARGRAPHHARRRGARVRRRRGAGLRRGRAHRDRRDHGRRRAARSARDTTRVAMEAATWNGTNILQTSKKLGLRTEASNRFEKQLHPAPRAAGAAPRGAADGRAVRRAHGARARSTWRRPSREPHRVALRSERARRACSASAIEPEESQAILERLGFGVERRDGDLEAEVPYFRHYDVYREADLIEEVARVHGLDSGCPRRCRRAARAVGGAVARRRSCGARSRTCCAARA